MVRTRRSRQPLLAEHGPTRPRFQPLTVASGSGGAAARLLALQAAAGNAAVQRLLEAVALRQDDGDFVERPVPAARLRGRGEPAEFDVEGGCDGLSLHGQANAKYNGGSWSVAGQKVTTSNACSECAPPQCLH